MNIQDKERLVVSICISIILYTALFFLLDFLGLGAPHAYPDFRGPLYVAIPLEPDLMRPIAEVDQSEDTASEERDESSLPEPEEEKTEPVEPAEAEAEAVQTPEPPTRQPQETVQQPDTAAAETEPEEVASPGAAVDDDVEISDTEDIGHEAELPPDIVEEEQERAYSTAADPDTEVSPASSLFDLDELDSVLDVAETEEEAVSEANGSGTGTGVASDTVIDADELVRSRRLLTSDEIHLPDDLDTDGRRLFSVEATFTLLSNGHTRGIRITKPSGNPIVDAAVREAIIGWRFEAVPGAPDITVKKTFEIQAR